MDVYGKLVLSKNYLTHTGENQIYFDIDDLEIGVYFIEISDKENSKKIKFIKF